MGDILFEPKTTGCFCTPEGQHRINFHCGAFLYVRGEPPWPAGKRIVVFKGHSIGTPCDRPKTLDDCCVGCLYQCPCKTKAKRKQCKAWLDGQAGNTEPEWIVTCKIESIDKPSLCIECRKHRCKSDEDELCSHCCGRNRRY